MCAVPRLDRPETRPAVTDNGCYVSYAREDMYYGVSQTPSMTTTWLVSSDTMRKDISLWMPAIKAFESSTIED